ncbi:MAG TPA: hypothetical protein VMF08_23540 [Candidatus Sulfotelmatobacter sp.]|nr:hypothetical protein [Candidatus Sulfotelmatobacter sp.]
MTVLLWNAKCLTGACLADGHVRPTTGGACLAEVAAPLASNSGLPPGIL